MNRISNRPTESAPQILTFFVGGEEYGVGILSVKEIVQFGDLTRIPSMPPWFRGVANLRGSVVPVIDLGERFGTGQTPDTRSTCIVIVDVKLEGEPSTLGLLVDSVSQVMEVLAGALEPAPSFGTRLRAELLLGMVRHGGKFVQLLDLEKLLSVAELLHAGSAADDASGGVSPVWEGALAAPEASTDAEADEPAGAAPAAEIAPTATPNGDGDDQLEPDTSA